MKNFEAWMLYDETETYTGWTLWPTQRLAKAEKKHQASIGNEPVDGVWKIKKVRVQFEKKKSRA